MSRHPETKAKQQANRLLMRARAALRSRRDPRHPMSRVEFADRVNEVLVELYPDRAKNKGGIAAFFVTAAWVGAMERGERTWTGDERRAALRVVAGAGDDRELGLYPPRPRNTEADLNPEHASHHDGSDLAFHHLDRTVGTIDALARTSEAFPLPGRFDGRAVDQSMFRIGGYAGPVERVMYTALETKSFARSAGASAVPDTVIEQLLGEIADLARDYGSQAPGVAAVAALHLHDRAREMLESTRKPKQRTDLYLALTQTSALLTSATSDLGLWTTAELYATAAYDYADDIGHTGACAYALGLQAMIAYWTGRPDEAVAFGLRAVESAPAGLATVRAQSLLARSWAHRGSADHVGVALRAADAARAEPGGDELHGPTGGEFGWSEPQHLRSSSTAWLQAGRPDQASIAAAQAIDLIRTQSAGTTQSLEAEVRADLAACYILDRRPDAAQEALEPAITTLAPLWSTPADSRRIGVLGRMDRIVGLLTEPYWSGVHEAEQLLELARSFSADRPPVPALLAP